LRGADIWIIYVFTVGLIWGFIISWHDRKIKINLNLLKENNLALSYGNLWKKKGYFLIFLMGLSLNFFYADLLASSIVSVTFSLVGYHFAYNWIIQS